jgi:hypothetical protein
VIPPRTASAADAGPAADAGAAPGEVVPPLVFELPKGAFAPVLRVELEGGPLMVRVTPPR